MWFLPSALNVKVKKFNQARVNGGSNYACLKVAKCLVIFSDAHEWINEIPTVPIYYLAKPQRRERAWQNQRGATSPQSSVPPSAAGS